MTLATASHPRLPDLTASSQHTMIGAVVSDCSIGLRGPNSLAQVSHLTIFIEDNQGDEGVTRVQRIQLLGVAQDTFDVAKIKKLEEG